MQKTCLECCWSHRTTARDRCLEGLGVPDTVGLQPKSSPDHWAADFLVDRLVFHHLPGNQSSQVQFRSRLFIDQMAPGVCLWDAFSLRQNVE